MFNIRNDLYYQLILSYLYIHIHTHVATMNNPNIVF